MKSLFTYLIMAALFVTGVRLVNQHKQRARLVPSSMPVETYSVLHRQYKYRMDINLSQHKTYEVHETSFVNARGSSLMP